MRIKDIWEIFPFPTKIRLFWDRVTLTKTTTIYFVFSLLHCIVQVIFQAHAFYINVQAADFLASVTKHGNATESHAFYVFENDLRLCDHVPKSLSTSSCRVIWNGTLGKNALIPASAVVGLSTDTEADSLIELMTNTSAIPTDDANNWSLAARESGDGVLVKRVFQSAIEALKINDTTLVVVNNLEQNSESAILDKECLWALGWPLQVLRNTQREDLTFILFQVWVLGMSIVAILNESIPHIIATLLTHLVAAAWAGFQLFDTVQFRNHFTEVTTQGACHPVNLLPAYWQSRSAAELPSFVFNAVALLVSAFLCWNLAKSFGWQTFKRVGASPTISRVYKIVLILSIVIQLSLFFILTSIALWLDQLWNGAIGRLATSPLYRPCLIVTLILLPVWLAFGWYSVRRERKIETLIFLVLCFGYLAGWSAMFDSTTFRWTYMTWAFFGVMTTTSVLLTFLALALGFVCRLNFGKGLLHYLKDDEPIEEGFEAVIAGDPEKAFLPSSTGQTFPVSFGSGIQVPPLLQMSESAQTAAPRFTQPTMRMVDQTLPQRPAPAITHGHI